MRKHIAAQAEEAFAFTTSESEEIDRRVQSIVLYALYGKNDTPRDGMLAHAGEVTISPRQAAIFLSSLAVAYAAAVQGSGCSYDFALTALKVVWDQARKRHCPEAQPTPPEESRIIKPT